MDKQFNDPPGDADPTDTALVPNLEWVDSPHNQFDPAPVMTRQAGFWIDQSFVWLGGVFALATIGLLIWIAYVIFKEAQPAISTFGLSFLWGQDWDTNSLIFGALPFIYGTLVSSAIAISLAVPIGLAVAVATSEDFLPQYLRVPIAFLVELIAAIPSVIVGLWGIFVLIPLLQPVQEWLFTSFGWFPLFGTQPFGPSMLAAGIILAVMILPTMAAIAREVLLVVPQELRSGSMALGATRWETIFGVLLPAGFSGVVGAAILALGRAIGETMAVTMVIGNSPLISPSLLEPAYTIPAVLANEFAEALEALQVGSLMYLALILFVVTLLVNVLALVMVRLLNLKQS